jgi:predicted  nucleic acid-binding Zn-ribbon protein
MIEKIAEIDGIVDKLELLIKTLREERDSAVNEFSRLKKDLDDREMELLQMDEEMQKQAKRFEEEKEIMAREQTEAQKKLDSMADRIRQLLPTQSDEIVQAGSQSFEINQNFLRYD